MAGRRTGNGSRLVVLLITVATAVGALVIPALAAVKPPPGTGKPVAAAGIGTAAALNNPRCRANDETWPGYGAFDATTVGGGPICVKPWKNGDDNGGATSQGVTKDRVKVVAVIPNDQQIETQSVPQGTAPQKRADKSRGTYEDAIHDYVIPQMKFYETWGRDVEVDFVTSSGSDEAAQRADVVTIEAMKPFAVFHLIVEGLDVLETELAKAHILTMGYSTTAEKAKAQAPYRWGLSDAQSSAISSGEVIGKQLAGKKAEFAGGDLKSQTRKFGVVYIPTLVDIDNMKANFKKYGGTVASENSYPANGSTFGDDAVSAEQAPVMVTRMKAAGVTTVILLSDFSMNKALMDNATKQDWFPEWFFTGAVYADIGLLARNYPTDQSAHAFGLSFLSPYTLDDPVPAPPAKSLTVLTNPLNWYWGDDAGSSATPIASHIGWLLAGLQSAGPELTPKTFAQGLFSIPAYGGAAVNSTATFMYGFGKSPNLPYDEYLQNGVDFAPYWWDPTMTGPSNGTGVVGKGVGWYADGAKRYTAGNWPKKQFDWFDRSTSVYQFETRQTATPVYVGDCQGCPSTGGPGQVGSIDRKGFVAKANGAGEAAL